MNKVEKVSIGKCAFSLEEKAYATVKQYLDELELYYKDKVGGKEILEGIEERMAELLMEKTSGSASVVTSTMIDEVIEILGKPEVIEEDSEDGLPRYQFEGKRKIYRDPTNKVLGGVCSGLAAYWNMDTVLLRFIVVAATLVSGWAPHGIGSIVPLAYLLAWIIIPKADTLRKQCELRGQSLNINDIEHQYKDGSAAVRENSDFWRVFGRVITILVGIFLVMFGISGLTACGLAAFGTTAAFHLDASLINELLTEFFDIFDTSYAGFNASLTPVVRILLIIFGTLTFCLPFIGCIYGGIHMIFNLKSPSWRPGLVIFILWLVAVVAFFVMLIIAATTFESWGSAITAFIPFLF